VSGTLADPEISRRRFEDPGFFFEGGSQIKGLLSDNVRKWDFLSGNFEIQVFPFVSFHEGTQIQCPFGI
jgi:hypothetical protein